MLPIVCSQQPYAHIFYDYQRCASAHKLLVQPKRLAVASCSPPPSLLGSELQPQSLPCCSCCPFQCWKCCLGKTQTKSEAALVPTRSSPRHCCQPHGLPASWAEGCWLGCVYLCQLHWNAWGPLGTCTQEAALFCKWKEPAGLKVETVVFCHCQ